MKIYSLATFLAGALAVSAIAIAASVRNGPAFISGIERQAIAARNAEGGAGIGISFVLPNGWLTRHPTLSGGHRLSSAVRSRTADALADLPGVGGVTWASKSVQAGSDSLAPATSATLHCQEEVEEILHVRTIRFAEASARIDRASNRVLDEVADALRPCLGSIIAVTGHTDSNGDETANVALSRARAEAVRWALIGRGIPADGLRATGVGSKIPLPRLAPDDPANRRIEFSVIEKMPLMPTPIDTPGPG